SEEEYLRRGYKPAEIHKHIYNLDAPIVITPNFDRIYDSYALSTSCGTILIKKHTDSDIAKHLLGGDTRLILKSHGCVTSPENIIFTRRDYAEARTKHVLFYEILKSLALTNTFLFIGCGTEDPDIRTLFEDIQFAHGRTPHHYMTLPKGEVHEEIIKIAESSMRIKFIEYSPEENHKELTDSLKKLVEKVDDHRDSQLSRSLKW
ncbi:SIR2 family protein, partial [Marichromatium sp. AB32]|uniref:SIR2 family NAD-dependent protein deacylase n=1 Tax=Marichromatium sp. AB32 TaxID=2483363 RepID=UPI000F3C6B75